MRFKLSESPPHQFCSWSTQALGGPPMQAICCRCFHSGSSSSIRSWIKLWVRFSSSLRKDTTSCHTEHTVSLQGLHRKRRRAQRAERGGDSHMAFLLQLDAHPGRVELLFLQLLRRHAVQLVLCRRKFTSPRNINVATQLE